MVDLLNIGKKNVGKRSIFSEIIIIDFYDGPTEAICNIILSDEWMISSLVYFDPNMNDRIFSIISASDDWLNEFKFDLQLIRNNNFQNYDRIKRTIKNLFENYIGEAFLLRCKNLSSEVYQIVQIHSDKLHYFDSVESVLNQSKQSQSKWMNAFINE